MYLWWKGMSAASTLKPSLIALLRYSGTFQGYFIVTFRTSWNSPRNRRLSCSVLRTSGSLPSFSSAAGVGLTMK